MLDDVRGKPALLNGKDSERLGLVTFHHNRVFASSKSAIKPPCSNKHPSSRPNMSECVIHSTHKSTLVAGQITKEQLVDEFADNFKGLGSIDKPAHFKLNSDVTPVHAGTHSVEVGYGPSHD